MPQHITVLNYDPEWPLKYEWKCQEMCSRETPKI